jgi:hypothetical protein
MSHLRVTTSATDAPDSPTTATMVGNEGKRCQEAGVNDDREQHRGSTPPESGVDRTTAGSSWSKYVHTGTAARSLAKGSGRAVAVVEVGQAESAIASTASLNQVEPSD